MESLVDRVVKINRYGKRVIVDFPSEKFAEDFESKLKMVVREKVQKLVAKEKFKKSLWASRR